MYRGLNIMEKRNIEERAAKVLNAIKYDEASDAYVDSVKLAAFFGFEVQEENSLSASEDGCITVSADETEKCIAVNSTRSFEFKRFIIVHELAHYFLHYMGDGRFFKHRENKKGKSMEENDADYLAACLLMPKGSFENQYKLLKKSGRSFNEIVNELQRMFCTPRESIERRISEVL